MTSFSSAFKKLTLVTSSANSQAARMCGRKSEATKSISHARKKKKQRGMATDKERKLLLLMDRLVGGRRLDETSGRRIQVVSYIFRPSALDTRQPITLSFKYY